MPSRAEHQPSPVKPETQWKWWALAVLVIVVLIIIVQNSQKVEFNLLFINTSAPLILLLLGATLIGAAIGYLTPIVRRDRSRDG